MSSFPTAPLTDPNGLDAALVAVLEESQALGFLGPGDVTRHIRHSAAFLGPVTETDGPALDLGSGGGLPGLVLAAAMPGRSWTLLDSESRRCRFLDRASARLGLTVEVQCGRAEALGREPHMRGAFGVVTARSFGPPAVTAECAAPFLRPGGLLVVAEPPESQPRWPAEKLEPVGLMPVSRTELDGVSLQLLRQVTSCPERYPRRVGVPARRPLF